MALHNPNDVEKLLDFAHPVGLDRGLRLVAITVVQVPRQMPIHEALRFAHHREPLLCRARAFAASRRIEVEAALVVAHMPSDGILAAAERYRAAALVMGWKGYANARDRLFGEIADRIIRLAPCDLMLLKLTSQNEIRTCLLPTAGGPNAKLAVSILSAVARKSRMSVTGAHVVQKDATAQQREESLDKVRETLELLDESVECQTRLIERVIVGGLITSTLITLAFLPCLYFLLERRRAGVVESAVMPSEVMPAD